MDLDRLVGKALSIAEQSMTKGFDGKAKTAHATKSDLERISKEFDELRQSIAKKAKNGQGRNAKGLKPGHCQVIGCGRKIDKWTKENKWRLCANCLLNSRKNEKPSYWQDRKVKLEYKITHDGELDLTAPRVRWGVCIGRMDLQFKLKSQKKKTTSSRLGCRG